MPEQLKYLKKLKLKFSFMIFEAALMTFLIMVSAAITGVMINAVLNGAVDPAGALIGFAITMTGITIIKMLWNLLVRMEQYIRQIRMTTAVLQNGKGSDI